MNIQRWIARREPNWQLLEVILEKLGQKGLKSLNYREIKELSSLYRGFQESGVLMNYIPCCPLLGL